MNALVCNLTFEIKPVSLHPETIIGGHKTIQKDSWTKYDGITKEIQSG